MRISDWSSDVCSSDLTGCAPPVCVAVEPDRRGGHSGRRKPGVDSQPRGAGRAAAVAAQTDVTGIEQKRPEPEPHAAAEPDAAGFPGNRSRDTGRELVRD